jgi:site-specific DNA-methyltransferase (adenine-specific)
LSKIKFLNGDAKKLDIPSNSVDLIITHPPYFGVDVTRYGGDFSRQLGYIGSDRKKFLNLLHSSTKEMYRVLKPTGSLWIANSPFDGVDSMYVNNVIKHTKFKYVDRIFQASYLDKMVVSDRNMESVASNSVTVWNHFAKTENFYYNHVECRRYNNPIWQMDFSNLDSEVDKELLKNYAVQDTVNSELVSRLIKMFSKPNHTVLDPFGGTGVVGVTAVILDRYGIVNDISNKQIEGAKQRLLLTLGETDV